ncbi:MAG: substrate-binding domain-containing protein [Kiritimatiellae bacterium]|nr:substrate-binding domain-containing protein [Kiritimatiellia bacterium]MBR4611164.1 substrate-binding domain-containing protein [Kiritimatiellia bacterium]
MNPVVLFLNDSAIDPTKCPKLAGVRRYAAAAGWNVMPIQDSRSGRRSIPGLIAKYRPIGCICDEDSKPTGATPGLFGGVPVVFANGYGSRYNGRAGRICVDNEAVARAAFRELAANNPAAFAVVGEAFSCEWSEVRVNAFSAEAAKSGLPCREIRENKWKVREEFAAFIRPWLADLPRHAAIYAVNDPIARRIADAAIAAGLRIPQDLTLLGTDNNPGICEASHPTLSSIQLDFERMGYLAAKMLGKMLARSGTNETSGTTGTACASHSSQLSQMSHSTVATIGPLLAMRRESTRGYGRREPHVLEAVEIIRREACDGLTVAGLAKRLPGSRRLLDLRFREAMGHSVHDEIQQVRLERVFDLLQRPDMPIGAIADFSGFALHQLDRVFRARFGCSLRAWRKRNAQP